jgi:predicted hotdog family 3-hydroxylacyl-ACP dehydratase
MNKNLSLRELSMSTITLSDLTIEDLLPHRDNMLLVQAIIKVSSESAQARFVVDKSWPMAEESGVHPLILVELAAQTSGICNGWDRVQAKGLDSEKTGWLVGIKKTQFHIEILPFGKTIIGRAANTYNFENLRVVSCELLMDDAVIGTTTLQLFQP